MSSTNPTASFPMRPLEAVKFSLLNCPFFHRPSMAFRQTSELLQRDGDFLIQDFRGTKLLLSVRVYGKVMEFGITILLRDRHTVIFELASTEHASLTELLIAFSKGRGGKCFLRTEQGDEFLLERPIHRQSYAGRLGFGTRMELTDRIRKGQSVASFVRALRPEFAAREEVEQDLERLIALNHRNLVRVCDYFKQLTGPRDAPVLIVRFELVPSAQTLFDRLFPLESVLNPKRYINWTYQAAQGVQYLLDHGLLHRRLHARACLLSGGSDFLRISDFWTENDPGDWALFQRAPHLPHTVLPTAAMYRDGWRYLPTETLVSSQFDSISQVWSFALLAWQIYTHCQFGNRIYYSSLSEFLSLAAGSDDPYHMPGHLSRREAQLGMPEQRRRKAIFLKACEQLPHTPDPLAEIVVRALSSNRAGRPFFSELYRVVESEKRILDLAHVLGHFL